MLELIFDAASDFMQWKYPNNHVLDPEIQTKDARSGVHVCIRSINGADNRPAFMHQHLCKPSTNTAPLARWHPFSEPCLCSHHWVTCCGMRFSVGLHVLTRTHVVLRMGGYSTTDCSTAFQPLATSPFTQLGETEMRNKQSNLVDHWYPFLLQKINYPTYYKEQSPQTIATTH